ncbi:Papilin, partial [Lucilia cuprina]
LATCSPHGSWGRGGRGCRSRVLWWYDRHLRSCRQMWYLGCGGNSNRWCSQQECLQRCRRIASCNPPPNWGHGGGGCWSRVLWWYDRNLRSCRQMWYGGCGGNANRWCSRSQCEQICRR